MTRLKTPILWEGIVIAFSFLLTVSAASGQPKPGSDLNPTLEASNFKRIFSSFERH